MEAVFHESGTVLRRIVNVSRGSGGEAGTRDRG